MDDPHRQPRDQDRGSLVARIKRAADEGRIGSTDRDIRLANVASAQSMAELDLIARDLDQLESSVAAGSTAASSWAGPESPDLADEVADKAVDVARTTVRSLGVLTVAVIVLALVGAGASALLAFRSATDGSTSDGLTAPLPLTPGADGATGSSGGDASATPGPVGAAYSLSGPGIRAFLQLYRTRFKTSQVVDLVLYDDYVVVDVPVPGKSRHEGWLFRNGSGFSSFGGVTADFPGARPVDLTRLAVPALVRNLARARATLHVEKPTTTYVIVRHYQSADPVPSVDIHVANQFNESGYLATTLDGTVERAYPFGQ